MQSSAIERIRQAEREADEALRRASQEAERIVEEARVQAAENDRAARLAADGVIELAENLARRQAEEAGAAARAALESELAELAALGAQRQPAAVERILRLIVG
jgi:vacuolar-type H+-ATPase subunit H